MFFLEKNLDGSFISPILLNEWEYSRNKKQVREYLFVEQFGFCAYTEEFLEYPKSSREIDHFNPLIKFKTEDNYFNWYLVSRWVNGRGKKGNNLVPNVIVESPRCLAEIAQNIKFDFDDGIFYAENNDLEANALIKFFHLNDAENLEEIANHLDLLEDRNDNLPFTVKELFNYPQKYLNYISLVEDFLEIPNLKQLWKDEYPKWKANQKPNASTDDNLENIQ